MDIDFNLFISRIKCYDRKYFFSIFRCIFNFFRFFFLIPSRYASFGIDFLKNPFPRPFTLPQQLDFHEIPIFIISFNRLKELSLLVNSLESRGFFNITIIDNNSTYNPLLEYYSHIKFRVIRLEQNLGHLAVWKSRLFNEILDTVPYVVTDCDVLPHEDCPNDFMELFYRLLSSDSSLGKVGFSLSISDIPDTYADKEKVIAWESRFWTKRYEDSPHFLACIDTTFALYRPGVKPWHDMWWRAVRTAPPYTARHLPWYRDSSKIDDEFDFYRRSVQADLNHW